MYNFDGIAGFKFIGHKLAARNNFLINLYSQPAREFQFFKQVLDSSYIIKSECVAIQLNLHKSGL